MINPFEKSIISLLGAVLLGTSIAKADEPVFPPHEKVQPSAAISEYARVHEIPIQDHAPPPETGTPLRPGDRSVAVVSLRDGRKQNQWLIDFTVVPFSSEEHEKVTALAAQETTLHTSSGRMMKFGSQPVAISAVVIGPLASNEKRIERALQRVEVKRTRIVVNEQFLGLGLDRLASTILSLRGRSSEQGFFATSGAPFPAEQVAKNRSIFDERGINAEDERAMAGATPALLQFFGIVLNTPGLREILFKAVDVPWWALAKSGGNTSPSIELDGKRMRPAKSAEGAYVVPLKISIAGKLALLAELMVERPEVPGSMLAGITAIHAGQPDGDGPRVAIELVATRRAP